MKQSAFALTGALLLLLAALAGKGLLLTLPGVPERPAAGAFDANRAAARLQRILGDERPHPVDSAADDAVRERLIAELRAVGLSPRITDDFACNGFARARAVACARVRNVVATIGPSEGSHVLLSAHYDSTAAGPGAGDAGIGVATLIETAALLRRHELRRPVTFLFNEGEEVGLLGARAFLERDPLAARVGALLNFEARGVEGPAMMFETSRPNGPAIAHFARSVDRPGANSLTTDLYGLIPNSTDVSVFEERDWTILNFAIIGNETRYHSAGDTLSRLDRRSLQHMGDQALALTLDLAAGEAVEASGERLYADFLGRQLITLPLVIGLALLGALLVFFLVEGWRRRALGRPLAAVAATLVFAAAIAWAGQALIGLIRDGDYWRGYPIVTHVAVYASALSAGLIAFVLIAPKAERERLRIAFWLFFLALGAALCAIAPGAAIFFLFPPLAAAAGIAVSAGRPGAERIGGFAALLLLYLSFGPPLALLEELLSGGPHWVFAPLAAVILLPALIELRPLIDRVPRLFLLAGAGDLFLLPWAAVALTPAYSDDRQQLFTVEYAWDADARRGQWAVRNDGAAVDFPADWRRDKLPYSTVPRWLADAPAMAVPVPSVEVLANQPVGGGRRVSLRLRPAGAESVSLVAAPDAPLRRAGSGVFLPPFGQGQAEERHVIRCVGRSCDGAVLDILIAGTAPVEFLLVGTRPGLPPAAAPLLRARPERARPQYAPDSTITLAKIRL